MSSYNRIILLGNLTRDPQMSYLPSGTAAVDFGVATNHRFRTADGQDREDVCFVDCRIYGKRAEVIQRYFRKGSQIMLEGRLAFDTWTAQDGSKRSKHRVQVENFEFVGSRGQSQGGDYDQGSQPQGGGYNQGGYNPPPQQQQQYNQPPNTGGGGQNYPPSAPPMPDSGGEDSFDPDDIPF